MGRRGELQIFNWEGKVRGEPLYCAGILLLPLSPFCAPSSHSASHWNHSGDWGNPWEWAREDGQPPQCPYRCRHCHARARQQGWCRFALLGGFC